MEPNEMFDNELEDMALEEVKEAAELILARLLNRQEDIVDASMMLDPADFSGDPLQLRVYLAILGCPLSYNEYFAHDVERGLRDRGDNNAANYVHELRSARFPYIRRSARFLYTRRDFLRQVMHLHDLTLPRRAYEEEMQLLEEIQEEGLFDDIELCPES